VAHTPNCSSFVLTQNTKKVKAERITAPADAHDAKVWGETARTTKGSQADLAVPKVRAAGIAKGPV
jgi:hypothetical protein